jgi:glycosyltransferase involved in cell wall biosynthesis
LLFGLLFPLALPVSLLNALKRRRSLRRSLRGAWGAWHGLLEPRLSEGTEYLVPNAIFLGRLTYHALRRRPDLIHLYVPIGVYRVRVWSWIMRLPLVFSQHTGYAHDWSPETDSLSRSIPHLDGMTVLDDRTAHAVAQRYGARCPVIVAPQPLCQAGLHVGTRPSKRSTSVRIGSLTRFEPEKGVDVLLTALAPLFEQLADAEALLAGAGPLEEQLLALRDNLGLSDRVHFVGWLGGQSKADFLASLDIFVLFSSQYEGVPIAILEAMAAAKPVVATRVGAVESAVVDEVTGILVAPRDTAGFAAALVRLAQDPELRARMGQAGRQRVEQHFRLDHAVLRMEELFHSVLAHSARAAYVPAPAAPQHPR